MYSTALSYLLYLLLLLLPLPSMTQPNITLGSSLSTSINSSWLSHSQEFAFGFRHLPNSNLSVLAIWFNKIPEKTIVWLANRDNPAPPGSKVELTKDGRLVLIDDQGIEIWKAETGNGKVTYAEMLDNGNFVLRSGNGGSDVAWESFAWPTDTILPGQLLGRGGNLSSRLDQTDYSTGRFQLQLPNQGKLVLYVLDLPADSNKAQGNPYWESDTAVSGSVLSLDDSGRIFLVTNNDSLTELSPENFVPKEGFYLRATLDTDGVFRQHAAPKNGQLIGEGSWNESRIIMPPDPCMVSPMQTLSGVCGFNSYCQLHEKKETECLCPPGYIYMDQNNPRLGCKQKFAVDACQLDQSELKNLFELIEMVNTDWPLSDFEWYKPFSEDQCREACIEDCFCAVAIHRDTSCWKKKIPLSNGRTGPQVGGKAMIKVLRSNVSLDDLLPESCREKKQQKTIILVGSVFIGTSVFINLLLLSVIFVAVVIFSYHKRIFQSHRDSTSLGRLNLRNFTYIELEKATDGFNEELGRGAFGPVYKGILASDSRNVVAIKKLDKVAQEGETEFRAEVSAIGQTQHKNLVRLLGFCDEGPHRLLVYEYMSNGSLASYIFKGPTPGWDQRMQIAIGIARGLSYLHEECNTQIIHCDVKPQNILLDDFFTPRISDFGLAKLLKTEQSRTLTGIRGTKGYVAAEWFKNVPITTKVDVYSFGVMLLEIVCCRKNVDLGLQDEEKVVLTDWAWDCYRQGRLDVLLANDEEALDDCRRLERAVMVAIWCIQEDPSLRPSMKTVTEMLEGVVEVQVPPDPSP